MFLQSHVGVDNCLLPILLCIIYQIHPWLSIEFNNIEDLFQKEHDTQLSLLLDITFQMSPPLIEAHLIHAFYMILEQCDKIQVL